MPRHTFNIPAWLVLASMLPLVQGCYPAVDYSQTYRATTGQEIALSAEGELRMRVGTSSSKKGLLVFVEARSPRMEELKPRIEIPCHQVRLKTTWWHTSEPIVAPGYPSAQYCTEPVQLPLSQSHLPYEVKLFFAAPGRMDEIHTNSIMEALAAKAKSALYRDWFELHFPVMKVEGVTPHPLTQPIVFRFERKTYENWRLVWFVPVSKG